MIALLIVLVVTSTGLANRQYPDGFTAAVGKSGTTPHDPPQERLHTEYTTMVITGAHNSSAVCLFIASVAPSSAMDTCGGPDWLRKDIDRSLSIVHINVTQLGRRGGMLVIYFHFEREIGVWYSLGPDVALTYNFQYYTTAVRKSRATPHGTSQEQCHMKSQGCPVDIKCAHKSGAVCRFMPSVAPPSVMDTRGGPDWCGKDMDRLLSIYTIKHIECAMIVIIYVMIFYWLILIPTETYFSNFPKPTLTRSSSGQRPSGICKCMQTKDSPSELPSERLTIYHRPQVTLVKFWRGQFYRMMPWTHCAAYLAGVATYQIGKAIYEKWWRQPILMKYIRNLIETDEYQYKYPVFVSASSYMDDTELRQLTMVIERKLQVACRTDRQLVCYRDNIEPGRNIFQETKSLLEKSGMMVIVISNRYSECEWCKWELKEAFMLERLVIQFGAVEQQTVNKMLRKIKPKCRMYRVDEECAITPDWESVCNSILQLLSCRHDSNEALLLLHTLLRPFIYLFNVIRQLCLGGRDMLTAAI